MKEVFDSGWAPWHANRDGVAEGQQHNAYHIEFYGPDSMMGMLYLGALLAGEIMAQAVGEQAAAGQYRNVREIGTK